MRQVGAQQGPATSKSEETGGEFESTNEAQSSEIQKSHGIERQNEMEGGY